MGVHHQRPHSTDKESAMSSILRRPNKQNIGGHDVDFYKVGVAVDQFVMKEVDDCVSQPFQNFQQKLTLRNLQSRRVDIIISAPWLLFTIARWWWLGLRGLSGG